MIGLIAMVVRCIYKKVMVFLKKFLKKKTLTLKNDKVKEGATTLPQIVSRCTRNTMCTFIV